MDEQEFLRRIRAEPDNEEVRFAYLDWIEASRDGRGEYVRLMRERMRLQAMVAGIDKQLLWRDPRIEDEWLDIAFPLLIRSPTFGRCYLAREPGAPPFVALGDYVTPDKVVCVIEAMKVFNDITAEVHGIVTEIAVANGAPVEFNQVLFRVSRPPYPIAGG